LLTPEHSIQPQIIWYVEETPHVQECRKFIFKIPRTLEWPNVLIHGPVIATYIMHGALEGNERIHSRPPREHM